MVDNVDCDTIGRAERQGQSQALLLCSALLRALIGLQGDDTLLAGSAGSTTPAAAAAPTPERATDLDGAHVRPTPAVAAAAVAPSCVIAGGCPEGNAASPLGPASPAAPISTPPIHDGITRPHPPPSTSPTSTLDPHGPGAQPLQGGPSRLGRAPTLLEALQADEGGYGSEETEMSEDEGGASWASFQTLCSSYVVRLPAVGLPGHPPAWMCQFE